MESARDPALEQLQILLKETLASTTDPKVNENLLKAHELVRTLSVRSQGVLNKFALDGQVALVTGAGQGIGRSIAHALGEAGCKVAVADLNLTTAETVVNELKTKGISSIAVKVDVSNKQDVEEMVKNVIDTFGDLHIGVNNAGIVFNSKSEETTEKEWNRTMGVNLNGVFFCCQAEAQHMLKKGRGSIINTASMSALIVNHPQNQVAYNVSKAGVAHMTRTLGCEWADRGVRVNCISPGYVDSDLIKTEALAPFRDQWIKETPMQRLCQTEELVGGVIYLASPLASYTTGLNLVMDGGFCCW